MSRDAETSAKITLLLDFYGELLTERQRLAASLYHGEDFSLSEVANELSITRQGVRDCLCKAEQILQNYENKLHLLQRFQEREHYLRAMIARLSEVGRPEDADLLAQAQALLENEYR